MKTRAHVFVTGRVQGVFFRSEARRHAQRQNVKGWIRNLPNGKVEAVFEGEEENVKELVQFCKHGSPAAKVTDGEVAWENYTGEFSEFEMR